MKTYRLYTLLALLGAMSFCTSCDDDEVVKTPLGTTSISSANSTVSSLTFAWEAVSGATQYAYELRDPDEALVKGDVTTALTATFTGLKDNTTYTLTVWSYAALSSDKTTSPIAKLTATTAKIVPLAAPAPTTAMQNGQMVVSWEPVENASYYSYQLYSLVDEVETEITDDYTYDASVTFDKLELGTYRFYIQSMSEQEAYSNSEKVMIEFERTKLEVNRITATYTGLDGTSGTADVVSYDDGSYTIEAFHGATGFNLDFAVNAETSEVSIINGSTSNGYNYVWTDDSHYIAAYTSNGRSAFEGDLSRGEVWFYAYYYDKDNNNIAEGYYDIVWGAPAVETWSAEGQFVMEAYPDYTWNAMITANGGGSYTIQAWYEEEGFDMNFTVGSDGTVTFVVDREDASYWYLPGSNADDFYIMKSGYGFDAEFSGNINGGSLKFYEGYDGWVTFTWGAGTAIGGSESIIDDLVGTYAEKSSCYDYTIDFANWKWNEVEEEISITKIDNQTIELSNLYGWGTPFRGTVDMNNRTITFAPQSWGEGWLFCPYDKPTESIVATFDENFIITISNWTAYYESYSYSYINEGATTVLTKK
ncbi:MAG: hypothetical protein SOW01_08635 [Mediterranea sp.]|nr:hypothetical protein [Mediterranea sp.]